MVWFERNTGSAIGCRDSAVPTGAKKGTDGDSFVSVTDHLYKPFEPAAVRYASMPGGLQEGINLIDASTVTLVLYDKDKKGDIRILPMSWVILMTGS